MYEEEKALLRGMAILEIEMLIAGGSIPTSARTNETFIQGVIVGIIVTRNRMNQMADIVEGLTKEIQEEIKQEKKQAEKN